MRSRAPLTDLFDIYLSVAGVPDVVPYLVNIPCRLVVQTQIVPIVPFLALRVCWITTDITDVFCGTTSVGNNALGIAWNSADFLQVTTWDNVVLRPLLMEYVFPEGEAGYPRFWCVLADDLEEYDPGTLSFDTAG